MKSGLKWCVLILVLTVFVGLSLSAQEKETAATDAASQWLALIDSGQYGESWFQASTFVVRLRKNSGSMPWTLCVSRWGS